MALVATGLLLSVATVWADDPPSLTVTPDGVSEGTLRLIVQGPAGITEWSAAADGSPLVAATVSETTEAATIVFAVETSSSMGSGRDERALDVVRRIMLASGSADEFALVTFGDVARVAQASTLDRSLLLDELATADPGFGSALYDGVRLAAELAANAEGPGAVVLVTRGWDFGAKSASSRDEALDVLQRSRALAYVLAMGSDVDARMIDGVAALGDGRRHADTPQDLAAIIAGLSESRASRYELAVSVEQLEPGVHELLLSAKGTLAITALTFERPAPTVPLAAPSNSSGPVIPIPEATAALASEPVTTVEVPLPADSTPLNRLLLGAATFALATLLILGGLLARRWRKASAPAVLIAQRRLDAPQRQRADVGPLIAAVPEPAVPVVDTGAAVDLRVVASAANGQIKRELRLYVGLVALALTVAYAVLALWAMLPLAFGWQSTVISSESMAPTVAAGDVIVARAYDGEMLAPGAIIVYRDPVRSGLLTHRIVTTTPDGQFVTKGDANFRADSTPVHPDQIIGVATLLVPSVALPVVWLEQGDWIRLGLALVAGALLIWSSRWALFDRYNPWSEAVETGAPDLGWRRQRAAIVIATTALFGAAGVAALTGSTESRAAFLGSTTSSGNSVTAASSFSGGGSVSILDAWTGELNFLTSGMTFDPSAGTDRLVMIAVYGEDSGAIASISSVSLGGTALTIVDVTDAEQTVGSGFSNLVWLGYLVDADIPAGTAITVSWVGGDTPDNGQTDPVQIHAVTLAGVDQTTPIGDTGGESNTSATSIGATAGVLNVTAGDMVVYATVSGQPNDHTAASGYTERLELDGISNNMTSVTATKAITAAGTEQPDAAWSTSQRLAIVTAVVNVAGG